MGLQIPRKLKVKISKGSPPETVEVDVLAVSPITVYPEPMKAVETLAITYQRGSMPPRVIWLDKNQYTPQILEAALAQDIEKTIHPPGHFEIP